MRLNREDLAPLLGYERAWRVVIVGQSTQYLHWSRATQHATATRIETIAEIRRQAGVAPQASAGGGGDSLAVDHQFVAADYVGWETDENPRAVRAPDRAGYPQETRELPPRQLHVTCEQVRPGDAAI